MKIAYLVSRPARADLSEIGDYIARDNPAAAKRMLDRFQRKFEMASRQPMIGEAWSDLRHDLRCVVEGRYLIFYRPLETSEATIEIIRVLHGARDVRPDMF